MRVKRWLIVGILASLFGLLGCAKGLEDQQFWVEQTRSAAETVVPDDGLKVWYSEVKHASVYMMSISASIEPGVGREGVRQRIADIQQAVAPDIVKMPVEKGSLTVDVQSPASETQTSSGRRVSINLDDLAEEYGLER